MRVFNFSAGPAALPESVLQKAQRQLVEYENRGMSVMEMSHRTPMYEEIIFGAMDNLRKLMNISDDYEVMFLQGGASLQFAMIPMNLMKNGKADYVVTGEFAKKAMQEGKKYGEVRAVADSGDRNYAYIPKLSQDMFDADADYVHITTNNTIYGTTFGTNLPNTGNVPLVADMSSNILSQEYDVNRFGLIYAGAQKNIGPSGVTVVIIKKSLIGDVAIKNTPSMLNYALMAKNQSMYNTPPTYGIYIAGLVFEELLQNGGVAGIQKINEHKAGLLYNFIDNSKFYSGASDKECRSIMNVTFTTPSQDTDAMFVKQATAKGMLNLKGHRSVGGMRASIYNAMPVEGVKALVDFMADFEKENA